MSGPISILDLRKKGKEITVNGGDQTLKVEGLSARQICDHLARFPALQTLSIGGTMTIPDALKATPGAMAAWVASACGQHQNAEAEAIAEGQMTIEDASFIVQESMDLTFSRGFGPFLGRLGALMSYLTVPPSRAPDTKSQPPSPNSGATSTNGSGNSPPVSSPPTSSLPLEEA